MFVSIVQMSEGTTLHGGTRATVSNYSVLLLGGRLPHQYHSFRCPESGDTHAYTFYRREVILIITDI